MIGDFVSLYTVELLFPSIASPHACYSDRDSDAASAKVLYRTGGVPHVILTTVDTVSEKVLY